MTTFEKNMLGIYGDKGTVWVKNLSKIVETFSTKWGLTEMSPLPDLTYHYVLSGFKGTLPVILKLGLDIQSLNHEAQMLRIFQGLSVIKLLEQSEGALLLERAVPGTSLTSYFPEKDEEALGITCQLIQRLQQVSFDNKNYSFPNITNELKILDKDWPEIPVDYLMEAKALRRMLCKPNTRLVLLHGDIHYDNILKSGEEWVIIDPKGIVGDPMYDIAGSLMRNPLALLLKTSNPSEIIRKRIKFIADFFRIEEDLIVEWAFLQSILAACWFLEDNQDAGSCLEFLSLLYPMLPFRQ